MKKSITILILIVIWNPLMAATFNIPNGNVTALIAAINTANSNNQPDIINLAENGEYVFTAVNNTVTGMPNPGYEETNGPVALPRLLNESVTGFDLIINFNGSTLRLSNTAPKMRLFHTIWGVSWKLVGGTIKDFESPSNNPGPALGGGGGAIVVGAGDVFTAESMIFENCKSNSSAERAGGALSVGGGATLTLKNCTFNNNSATNHGGAVTVLLSDILVENCIFDNNRSTNAGGAAIYVDGCTGWVTDPGGLGKISGCTFSNNISKYLGGAVFLQGYNEDIWIVEKSQFSNNKSTDSQAGALWHSGLSNGQFNVTDCSFENNEAKSHGGAIRCTAGANKFSNCTFYGNKTFAAGSLGGAIWNFEDPQANRTWFSTIENCTFANNIAGGYGGALVISNDPAGNIRGSIKNTIISNNKAYQQCGYPPPAGCNGYNNGNNCGSILTDLGNNIEYPERPNRVANPSWDDPNDRPCFNRPVVLGSNTMPVINPLLLSPALNGSNTKTMALQGGSPAINAGNGCTPTDQRGAGRVGACDIGAYEYSGTLSLENIIENKNDLQVYPNPSSGNFFVRIPKKYQNQDGVIQIFSIEGKLILIKDIDKKNITAITLETKGLYILKTSIGSHVFTNKILIH